MIKIDDINKTKDVASRKTAKSSSSGDESFSILLKETMKSQSNPVNAAGGINVADAIFATQMVDGEEEKEIRKKLVKRGQTLLEKLEEIRDGLLMGYISRDRLIEISRFVKDNKFQSSDPKLQEILSEIELRVEVELAKLMK